MLEWLMKYIGSNEKMKKNHGRIEDVEHGSTDINCELPLFLVLGSAH